MNKKVLLVTLFDEGNIGNRLQNYALQTKLISYGVEVTTLDNYYTTDFSTSFKLKMLIKRLLINIGFKKYKIDYERYQSLKNIMLSNINFDNTNLYNVIKIKNEDSEKLVGRSLTLKDNIDMNYYMELPESIKSNSNAYMEFTVNNSQPYKVSVNDAIPVEKNGKVIYKFACPLNAAQMSDTVKAKMVVDGNSGNEYTYSVKEYATELLSKSNEYPEETIKLVKALLNYGTAAQNFFKYNTDKPANAGLSDTDKAVAAADFEEYKAVIKTDSANGQSNGLTYYGSSLICKSEMTVRHYFMVNEGCDINNYKFSYVNADGNEVSLTPKKASDGVYCVDINGIMARNLNSNYACKVTGKNKACIFELDYGPFSYSQKVINSGNSSDELKNLVNALYWYWYYGYRN